MFHSEIVSFFVFYGVPKVCASLSCCTSKSIHPADSDFWISFFCKLLPFSYRQQWVSYLYHLYKPCFQITNGFIGTCGFESPLASNTLLAIIYTPALDNSISSEFLSHTHSTQLLLLFVRFLRLLLFLLFLLFFLLLLSPTQPIFHLFIPLSSGHTPLILSPSLMIRIRKNLAEPSRL